MNKNFLLRALVSGGITLLVLGLTSALGLWQYSQSQRDDIQNEVLAAKPVALTTLHTPEEFVKENVFARQVELVGTLDCDNALSLSSRTITGLVCLFQNNTTLPIAVVFSEATRVTTSNTDVSLLGRLQPSQSYEPVSYETFQDYQITEMNIHSLVGHYQQNLFDGFVVAESMTTDTQTQEFVVEESTLILPPAGIEFRNLFYAWQWWIFAGFALLLWVKYVRDEWRKQNPTL